MAQRYSKYLSLLLRHNPGLIDLDLAIRGRVSVKELIDLSMAKKEIELTREDIEEIVSTNGKKRFAFNDDKTRIRALQGHSLDWVIIEKEDVTSTCPDILYHGTSQENAEKILASSLKSMGRNEIHLSKDIKTAKQVGSRHGKVAVFEVDMRGLENSGQKIYISENGVYLTIEDIDVKFLKLM